LILIKLDHLDSAAGHIHVCVAMRVSWELSWP